EPRSCVLLRHQCPFEFGGWPGAQRRVQPLLVVYLVDEPFQAASSLRQIAVLLPENLLVFQGLHPRLAPAVFPRARFVTHAALAPVRLQQVGVVVGSVLAAAIGMMD